MSASRACPTTSWTKTPEVPAERRTAPSPVAAVTASARSTSRIAASWPRYGGIGSPGERATHSSVAATWRPFRALETSIRTRIPRRTSWRASPPWGATQIACRKATRETATFGWGPSTDRATRSARVAISLPVSAGSRTGSGGEEALLFPDSPRIAWSRTARRTQEMASSGSGSERWKLLRSTCAEIPRRREGTISAGPSGAAAVTRRSDRSS